MIVLILIVIIISIFKLANVLIDDVVSQDPRLRDLPRVIEEGEKAMALIEYYRVNMVYPDGRKCIDVDKRK